MSVTGADLDAATAGLPADPPTPPPPVGLGVRGWLRWCWRQLTSMRTALLLLFLLAVAAVPGSLLPQRAQDPVAVRDWIQARPTLGPLYDRLGLFEVYGSPWFAAVYLLLFASLVGCVLPRAVAHYRALRTPPPPAPARLDRLPSHVSFTTPGSPEQVLQAGREVLRGARYRVADGSGRGDGPALSAERGFWRETGNLVFHLSLLVLLLGVALSALLGWRGNVLVVEGQGFSNQVTRYDSFTTGRLVRDPRLVPFSFTLERFTAQYQTTGPQQGAPTAFQADVTYRPAPGAADRPFRIEVNHPLEVGGTKVFLVGHGYAPVVTVTDGQGRVVFSGPAPFLPQDRNFTSTGVVKAPDARPQQIGLTGIFLPTATVDPTRGPVSVFPAAESPALFLGAFTGDLGLDDGEPQSVFRLDTTDLTRVGLKALRPGETWELPDGVGTVRFDGVKQYATFSVARDPGRLPVLLGAIAALAGLMLSLFVPRRRAWVRATPLGEGRTLVEVAGLARTEAPGLADDVEGLAGRLRTRVGTEGTGTTDAAEDDRREAE